MEKEEDEFVRGVGFKNYKNELELLSEEKKKDSDCNVATEHGQALSPLSAKTMTTNMHNSRDKKMTVLRPSVPFHIPTIPRPQDEFNIFVNNTNQPFEHVWLQRSEDGSRVMHPLEKLSESDFIDQNVGSIEPVKPPPIENTPFKLVEDVKELKQLAAKLHSVNEFAVDLEHNKYRSFQGLTCLMQISTRAEDYVVDTLKLRVYVGPYLREVFKDPSKRKVMHGADQDIKWLQRDFGIYICNMFDTQQVCLVPLEL
ncbi:Rrp6-like [Thalictrum thalictroides]|uniref:Rrp6-like n=1 Tax=Thalictrum thalictroides TaxID=46969 RepID=A0A7J6VM46_THATH|nr:Rrp6-like [Thalictrum thalictroides]